MEPIKEIGPKPEILDFFKRYMLTGVKNLNADERVVYLEFLRILIMQRFLVDPSKINMDDLIHANEPGAIIKTKL